MNPNLSTLDDRENNSKFFKTNELCPNLTCYLHEDHKKGILGISVNPFGTDGLFATVGDNRISVYNLTDQKTIKLKSVYQDEDKEEIFYSCAWSYDINTGEPIIVAGGLKGLIRIVHLDSSCRIKTLIGHGGPVNDLKFHYSDPGLLISASKDCTLMMWNISTLVCIVKFGGIGGHRDEVLTCDISMDGQRILTGGSDHSIKIWFIKKPKIEATIKASHTYKLNSMKSFETFFVHFPDFTTRNIHHNYVDCVRWFGNIILSKSCENCIILWRPNYDSCNLLVSTQEIPLGSTTILYTFESENNSVWFVRFSIDREGRKLCIGNQCGTLKIWDLTDCQKMRSTVLSDPMKCLAVIRQTAFSNDSKSIIAVADDSSIWRWDYPDM